MSTATAVRTFKTGLNYDLPEDLYFTHPALSASTAKSLLADTPARYRWRQQHPVHKADYDLGHYVHGELLGSGAPVVIVDADDWRTKVARDARDAAYAEGKVPMLAKVADVGDLMVASVREYLAAAGMPTVFARGFGHGEVSILWDDEQHGIPRRARLDWLHNAIPGQPRMIVDLKTAASADPRELGRVAHKFGYHAQADWYREALRAVTGETNVAFVHVTVEKDAPYLVSATQLDEEALALGRAMNDRAIRLWKECRDADRWPGFPTQIQTVSLPPWAARDLDD